MSPFFSCFFSLFPLLFHLLSSVLYHFIFSSLLCSPLLLFYCFLSFICSAILSHFFFHLFVIYLSLSLSSIYFFSRGLFFPAFAAFPFLFAFTSFSFFTPTLSLHLITYIKCFSLAHITSSTGSAVLPRLNGFIFVFSLTTFPLSNSGSIGPTHCLFAPPPAGPTG